MTRDLRLLTGAVLASATGDFLALVTLAVVVHDLTGSGMAVAALFATTLVPPVALAPVAGWAADRFDRVRVLLVAAAAQAAAAAALAAVDSLPAILALSAVLAAGAAVAQPAEFTLVAEVAAPGRLAQANGIVESARYTGFTLGPVLAGAAVATGGHAAALLADAATFLVVVVAASRMRVRSSTRDAGVAPSPLRLTAGGRALTGDPVLRVIVVSTTAALVFISASLTIEVFYAKDVLGAGDAGYAALVAAWTAGMVAGATGLAGRVPAAWRAPAALAALAVQGAGLAAQTGWVLLPVALAGYLVGGIGHGVKNALVRTVLHDRVPASAHGRAFAAYGALRNTAELAAVGGGGLLVGALGPRTALLVAGLGPLVAGLAGLAALVRRPARAPAAVLS